MKNHKGFPHGAPAVIPADRYHTTGCINIYVYSSLCSPPLLQNPVYRFEKNLLHGRLFGAVRIYFFLVALSTQRKNHPHVTVRPVRPLPLTNPLTRSRI